MTLSYLAHTWRVRVAPSTVQRILRRAGLGTRRARLTVLEHRATVIAPPVARAARSSGRTSPAPQSKGNSRGKSPILSCSVADFFVMFTSYLTRCSSPPSHRGRYARATKPFSSPAPRVYSRGEVPVHVLWGRPGQGLKHGGTA